MDTAGDSVEPAGEERPIAWPWYIRWLAVAHVLSRPAGFLGFLVLAGLAAVRIARRGPEFDAWTVALVAAALACPAAGAVFRWWFTRWGQRHWPADDAAGSGRPGW